MTEELEQLLENLKLRATAAHFDEMLAAAESSGTPVATFITQLLRLEWEARQAAALEARIRRAHFPEAWTLESFPFKVQTGVKERQFRTFAQLEFSRIPRSSRDRRPLRRPRQRRCNSTRCCAQSRAQSRHPDGLILPSGTGLILPSGAGQAEVPSERFEARLLIWRKARCDRRCAAPPTATTT